MIVVLSKLSGLLPGVSIQIWTLFGQIDSKSTGLEARTAKLA